MTNEMLTKGDDFDRTKGLLAEDGSPLELTRSPARAKYFYRLRDDRITEFCVENACGPQSVESLSPDGQHRKWQSYWEGDLLVFYSPYHEDSENGIFWAYDKRLQIGEPCDRRDLEKLAMRMRVSCVVTQGMKDAIG